MRTLLRKIKKLIIKSKPLNKNESELDFWKKTIIDFISWFNGEKVIYESSCPKEDEKIYAKTIKDSAIFTWKKKSQEAGYLIDLKMKSTDFSDMKILDIGSGPMPSAQCFAYCDLYCLDPLWADYIAAGFPTYYENNFKIVNAFSEDIPFEDNYFDAVISVNALDHVDDFYKTIMEIERVLKPDGLIRLHLHYHEATVCEPISLNDDIIQKAFIWCKGFKKIDESTHKVSCKQAPNNEKYTLWSNFD